MSLKKQMIFWKTQVSLTSRCSSNFLKNFVLRVWKNVPHESFGQDHQLSIDAKFIKNKAYLVNHTSDESTNQIRCFDPEKLFLRLPSLFFAILGHLFWASCP